ncbi:MAG: glycosyltransferase family 9 protein [Anaerolineaceae bacterium]|nr:glycosyltransferase family 9 protein [Anaerolineaceae bacterium]MCY3907873.1 glycosyltransferase family 9 protein [Anaerolineaceae bacterium]
MSAIRDLKPRRIALLLPCCIGDVLMATPLLAALRNAWPDAHVSWVAGAAARALISDHDQVDATLECDPLPQRSLASLWQLSGLLRDGRFDLVLSLSRSPLISLAVGLSGIPQRVGLDSAGRGFGYNLRVPLDPGELRHEADIYLEAARALGLDVSDCPARMPVQEALWPELRQRLQEAGIDPQRYVLLFPAGGSNPGMQLPEKRWPARHFAQLARELDLDVVLVGGPQDGAALAAVGDQVVRAILVLAGELTFAQIALLARRSVLSIGNDSGLTHLAAAAGGRTVAIFGPSDPRRYAPSGPAVLVLWKPGPLPQAGVSAGAAPGWNWREHGIGVAEVSAQVQDFLATSESP